MGRDRSARAREAIPPSLVPIAVIVGVVAMAVVGPVAVSWGLGLRPTLVLSELALVAPAMLALVGFGVPFRRGLGVAPMPASGLALSALAGVTLWLASLGLVEVQYSLWSPPEGFLETFRRLHAALRPSGPVDALVSVAAIALAPAFCEEALFRGAAFASFLTRLSPGFANVGAAVLFGLIHLDLNAQGVPALYRVPFAFAVGIGLGILRLRAGTLAAPIAAHAALNTLTFLVAPLADDPGAGLPAPRPWVGLGLLAAGAAASVLVIRRVRVDSAQSGT
jgi:membrane protease YdiL (CAAX protease family)